MSFYNTFFGTLCAMKRGQLIGYNMKNIFLEKPYTKCGGETSSRPISKKLKLSMNLSLDQQSEHLYSFLLFCVKIEDYQNILKPLAFTSYEAFWKNKKRSRISLLASFSAWLLRGNILMLDSINWLTFIVWLTLLSEILENMCILIIRLPVCDALNFYQVVFPHDQKSQDKNLNISRTKKKHKGWNKKA